MINDKIKTLIVDDEPLARRYIRKLLNGEKRIEVVGECENGAEAARFISIQNPDLVFLDIQMPEMDGFSMLKTLNLTRLPLIVFTTAYEEYAIRAFEIHAIDYLLKPFDQTRLRKSLDFILERYDDPVKTQQELQQITELLKHSDEKKPYLERLLLKKDGRIVFLRTQDITWIKADDKYIHIFFGKSNHLVRQTLSAMKSQLNPRMFIQINRSTIVNVEKVVELNQLFNGDHSVILQDKTELNLSKNYKNELFELLGKPLQ